MGLAENYSTSVKQRLENPSLLERLGPMGSLEKLMLVVMW
jgi:hypothetical protein